MLASADPPAGQTTRALELAQMPGVECMLMRLVTEGPDVGFGVQGMSGEAESPIGERMVCAQ